jgi:hypothetical protein
MKCCLRITHKCVSGFLEATPECKQECGLPEETVISSKETGSLLCADQSPIGLESLFSQESIVESVGHCALASATTHTENGFDDSKDCHNKSALENVHVPEPCSHNDTKGGIFKNVDCMHTSQRDDRMEGIESHFNFLGLLPTYSSEIFPAI